MQDFAPSKGRVLRGLVAVIIVLILGVVVFRIMVAARRKPQKKDTTQALSLKVSVQSSRYAVKILSLRGFGTVEPARFLEIVPEVSGKVVYVLRPEFKVGVYVRKGQTLMTIERNDYLLEYNRLKATIDSTEKQIKIAERAYRLSQVNLDRSRRLVRRSALDPGSFEMAQQQVLDRGQRLESLRQSLDVNRILLRRAALSVNRTVIQAPFDARISQGHVTTGTFVAAGRPVGALESVDSVEIPVAFGLGALRNLLETSEGTVSLKELPQHLSKMPPVLVISGGKEWKGRVVRVASSLDRSTRTLTLYVRVDLKQQNQIGNLLPGTFCAVTIPMRRVERAITLPRHVLYQGNRVYVAEDNKIAVRRVQVAYLDSDSVVLRSGLTDGDNVIVTQLTDPVVGTPLLLGGLGGKR